MTVGRPYSTEQPTNLDLGEEKEFDEYEAIVLKRAMTTSRLL